jgi:hypothetical protein
MSAKPYSKLIDILRSTLQQVEKDTSGKAADGRLNEVKLSLKRTIDSLESRKDVQERDDDARQKR